MTETPNHSSSEQGDGSCLRPVPATVARATAGQGAGIRSLEVTLPLPPKCLHKNARPHWGTRARATKKARTSAHVRTLHAIGRGEGPKSGTIHARWYFAPSKRGAQLREHDDDGLSHWLVAYRDGIADALKINDNRLRMGRHEVNKSAEPRVVLTVEGQ